MRWLVWIILVVVIADVSGRLIVLRGSTDIRTVESTKSGSRTLLVYFPGILADGVSSSVQMVSLWRQYGDVLLVSYAGKRFNAADTAASVANRINFMQPDYDTVVFIGSSMGGLLSRDTAQLLDNRFDIKFVLVDAPTGRSDLQPALALSSPAMWVWWAGPLSNLLSGAYFGLTFRPPKDENVEQGVDREVLDRHVAEAKDFPLSIHNDWIRYIIGSHGLRQRELIGYDGIYIRSMRDTDTVRDEAFDSWNRVFGGFLQQIQVDSPHVGYNEQPTAWRRTFDEAFDLIDVIN